MTTTDNNNNNNNNNSNTMPSTTSSSNTTSSSSTSTTLSSCPSRSPTNALVTAMLTDMYQITMAYAYWKNNKHNEPAVFELFFRQNPFHGEFTIFAGLDECLAHLHHFCFTVSDIDYLKTVPALQHCDVAFFDWLLHDANLKTSSDSNKFIKISAMRDGTVCFPRVPLITIEAPLAIGQLLETTLLTLVNYPSLITTNAARMVHAVSLKKCVTSTTSNNNNNSDNNNDNGMMMLPPQALKIPICVEFGLRRAQGPDGGMSASKYSQMGGFNGTSNVQAGKLFDGIQLTGTHAHAFVQSFASLTEVQHVKLPFNNKDKGNHNNSNGNDTELVELLPRVLEYRRNAAMLVPPPGTATTTSTTTTYASPPVTNTNDGELAAFIAYAAAFPHSFLCLIDTYDTLTSGLWNFLYVALVLDDLGYKPMGIRLDSGNLAALSMACATTFLHVGRHMNRCERFTNDLHIVASNDLNEAKLLQHATSSSNGTNGTGTGECAITSYGIGTNLVTCQAQPALGCVYKLVQLNGQPRIKLSQDFGKILIPGHKQPYRLYDQNNVPILDVMTLLSNNGKDGDDGGDGLPVAGQAIVCRDAFNGHQRVRVIPSRVEPLHVVVFSNADSSNGSNGNGNDNNCVVVQPNRTLQQAKVAVQEQMVQMQPLGIFQFENPKPYKVAVSERLYTFMNDLWQSEAPMKELS